jgi:hypothetical protein
MKSFRITFLLLILISSCSKDDAPPESPYYFKCKINGNVYSLKRETEAFATLKTSDTYWIYGKELATGKELYIRVGVNQGVGMVQMKGTTQGSFLDTDKTNYHTNNNSGNGEISILEKTTTTIKGKFTFVANTFSLPIKKAQITEGEFFVLIK